MSEPCLQRLRLVTPEDVPALAALYAETARTMGPACYTVQQVQAWQRFGRDTPAFRNYVLQARTWVLDDPGGRPCGFCGIDAHGEVRSFYVRASLTRQGLGRRLLRHALVDARAQGVQQFAAWATPFSRPVFEREGFVLQRVLREAFEGVEFDRYRLATVAR